LVKARRFCLSVREKKRIKNVVGQVDGVLNQVHNFASLLLTGVMLVVDDL
jgi:hypothetical protein